MDIKEKNIKYSDFKKELISLFVKDDFEEDDLVHYMVDYKESQRNESVKEWASWYFQDWIIDNHNNCLKSPINHGK